MERRIFGLENEYGVTCTLRGQRRLSPDEVARYLFRRVVSWGRSSNVFLANGARLYLDVGSHPEYATPECDSIYDLVVHDKAGERILEQLLASAEQRLREEGIRGVIYLFKNNTDSAGNSYGCHENYLTSRRDDFSHYAEVLIPFLVSRQIYAGAGKVLQTARGAMYCISQRAEHIWEGVSTATTRSRPIINTRDEPHADAERYRRLHVIVGDSNMSEYATFLKVGACRDPAAHARGALDRAARHDAREPHPRHPRDQPRHHLHAPGPPRQRPRDDARSRSRASTSAARCATPSAASLSPLEKQALDMWEHCLTQLESDPLKLDRECDWVIKHNLIEAYREKHDLPLSHPAGRAARPAVPRREPRPRALLQAAGSAASSSACAPTTTSTTAVDDAAADHAGPAARRVHPPGQGAQARLHGRLGAPEAQRPGPAHRAVQGPVQVPRRARREAHRQSVAARWRPPRNWRETATICDPQRQFRRWLVCDVDKLERLLNLTAALLHTERPLTADEIR